MLMMEMVDGFLLSAWTLAEIDRLRVGEVAAIPLPEGSTTTAILLVVVRDQAALEVLAAKRETLTLGDLDKAH
jgi:hypothetical protein